MTGERKTATYWDYIRVEDLLGLQGGLNNDESTLGNDEVLFIVVHQVYELWFKLVIRELESVKNLLLRNPVPEQDISSAVQKLERCGEIFRVASDHFRVIETISTRDYLDFRDKLFPASGFQSAQMREIEILMGLTELARVPFGGKDAWKDALKGPVGQGSPAFRRVEQRAQSEHTLKTVMDEWLYRTPIQASQPGDENDEAVIDEFLQQYLSGHDKAVERQLRMADERGESEDSRAALAKRYAAQSRQVKAFLMAEKAEPEQRSRVKRIRAAAIFITSYRELPLLAWPRRLMDKVVEFEQLFLIFRQRHARMVERVIGRRVGTGGSAGVAYLDNTALKYRVFDDLWAVRTVLLDVENCPPLVNAGFYGFKSGE